LIEELVAVTRRFHGAHLEKGMPSNPASPLSDATSTTGHYDSSKRKQGGRPPRGRRWWRPERWEDVPYVRSADRLTPGERAADKLRNGMGSWSFVFGALLFLVLWMAFNVILGRGGHHVFDKYPFILLNLVLSCLAAMQGAILLIAAKRADQISSELAAHDYEVNRKAEKLIEENTELTQAIKELTEAIHARIVGTS
jgi:hypothetical protein